MVNVRYFRDLGEDNWQLLTATNDVSPQFFQFGNALCDLVSNANGVCPRILTLTSLRNRLDRLADYISIDQRGDEHPARARRDLLEDMLAQANPPVLDLQGVVEGPICR